MEITMTLTEFLLARIAEDKQKRDQEVRRYAHDLREDGFQAGLAWIILRLIAQPYADHPDYRDEWRP